MILKVGLLALVCNLTIHAQNLGKSVVATKHNKALTLSQIAQIQPGLGTIMMEFGHRFYITFYAAKEGNWDLAEYELHELIEAQEIAETTRPKYTQQLKAFEHDFIDPLAQTIKAKDWSTFSSQYDKTILDNSTNPQLAKEIRDGLVNLYSVIKGSDEFLKFAFLTGVSKFTKTSLFSGLNNIKDISLNKRYGDICGYTQNDVETTIKPYLDDVDMDKLKSWYNGYNFLGSDMYNPFDILLFIDSEFEYKNYWFETGTPTFLMELIKKYNYFLPTLTNLRADERLLDSFDIENLDLEVILYQAGYLTIDKVETTILETQEYLLKVPNKEVRQSLSDYIIRDVIKDRNPLQMKKDIFKSLLDKDLLGFKNSLSSMFASIPYNNYTKNDLASFEGFYASVIYIYLQSLGFNIIGEDVTNRGRIDLTIEMENVIYIMEFKVDAKTGEALQQIKDKKYYEKYLNRNKDIYLIGIEFDTNEKNISEFEWELI